MFIEELPHLINELTHLVQQAQASNDDQSVLQQAIDYAHGLEEKSGQAGLAEIQQASAEIENSLIVIQGSQYLNKEFSGEVKDIWSEATEKLMTILASARTIALKATTDTGEQAAKASGTGITDYGTHSSYNNVFVHKLLLVDDDQSFLDLIEKFGSQKLVHVLKTSTTVEALKRAKTVVVDAAMLGLQLGENDTSFDLATQLRQLIGYENLPVAFVSETSQIYNRIAAAQAGACIYLTKPVNSSDLDIAFQQLFATRAQHQPRILVLDDDEALSSRTASVLENSGMQVATLNDPVRVLDVLEQISPDLLILDVVMPGINGLDVCRMLRTVPRWQDLPVIFISSLTSVDMLTTTFKSGGDDYIVKPWLDEELVTRVKARLDRARALKTKSHYDSLTGLLLRQPFIEQLNGLLNSAQKQGSSVSLCLFNINDFKAINYEYGYQAGDTVLNNLGQLITKRFTKKELCGRWGNDEFIIVFFGNTSRNVIQSMKNFLDEFHQIKHANDNRLFSATASSVVSTFPEDGTSGYELIRIANQRLLASKSSKTNFAQNNIDGGK